MKKNWQKIVALMMVLALCATLAVVFTACGEERLIDKSGTAVIAVASGEEGVAATAYTVDLSKVKGNKGLISVLDYLKEKEGLTYTMKESDYGPYLTQVNGISQNDAGGEYIYLYTTVAADFDVSAYATTVQYNGQTLTNSGLGASQMHIKKDSTIYIGIIKW